MMEDKIGLGIGANRIGINYFSSQNYDKSLEFHKLNLQLSDTENVFAPFYNIGICYRKLNNIYESNNFFTKSLEWS